MKFDVLHAIDKLVPAAKLIIRGEQVYENVEWFKVKDFPEWNLLKARFKQTFRLNKILLG